MQIHIEYGTQVRMTSGKSNEQLEISEGSSVADLLKHLVETRSATLGHWLAESGEPRPGLLVFLNDQSATDLRTTYLKAGDQVALMTLVSGG
jgi:molybdopterin converting factor small subunit